MECGQCSRVIFYKIVCYSGEPLTLPGRLSLSRRPLSHPLRIRSPVIYECGNRIGSICIFIPAIRFESLELKWDVFYYKNLIDASWLEGDRLKVSFWLKVPGRKTQDLYLYCESFPVDKPLNFPLCVCWLKKNANEGGKKASKQTWMWVVKSPGWS